MTRNDPILAWRSWRLRTDPDTGAAEPVLESCVYGDPWPQREAFSAFCPDHERPVPECGCGIYAVTTREAALEWARWAASALPNPIVLGQVHIWGRVLPHSTGYRGEHAYPYELELLAGGTVDTVDARRLERELRNSYLVDTVERAA